MSLTIYNKTEFYNQTIEKRYFEVNNAVSVTDDIRINIVKINNPTVSTVGESFQEIIDKSQKFVYGDYKYIRLTQEQCNDGIDPTSIVVRISGTTYYSQSFLSYDNYKMSGGSIVPIDLGTPSSSAFQCIILLGSFILYPANISGTCNGVQFKTGYYQPSLKFSVSLDKSRIEGLYTNNFTFYSPPSDVTYSDYLMLDILDKAETEGLSGNTAEEIQSYANNYFPFYTIHKNKMYIHGVVLYNEDKVAMAVMYLKYPIVLPNNVGITLIGKAKI